MKRICIISPGHLATNPRLVKEADALAEAGYEVAVIVGDYLLWARDKDRSFSGKPWRVAAKLPFGPHAPKAVRVKQLLQQKPMRWAASRRMLAQAFVEAAAHPISTELRTAALSTPADLYIAHYVAALPAAAAAARHHNVLYAYDAEDFHLGDWPDEQAYAFERRLVRAIEGRYLPGCTYVSASSPLIAEALVDAYGIAPPTVVLNVFPKSQAPAAPTTRGSAAPSPSIYWFSQTIGPNRGLECAIHAIGLSTQRPHLYLRGNTAKGYLSVLEKLAVAAGVGDRIHILPPAEPERMETLAADYDLGLASEVPVSRNREICLTNKLFSFLLAGLPPLMSATPAQRHFAEDAGLTDLVYPIDDAPALAALIDRLLADQTQLVALREKVWGLGQERYCWEAEGEIIKRLAAKSLVR